MAFQSDDGEAPPFRRIGPAALALPVILSVPHAGRAYSESLLAAARIPQRQLQSLEDRLVDRLIWRAVAAGATALVADAPRAAIDLNRHEREMDPLGIAPPLPELPVIESVRTRSGLGIVPTRHPSAGAIWRRRLTGAELEERLTRIHRPFHAALRSLLDDARETFGTAILLDCHSMPPRRTGGAPEIVFGDRHGTSCHAVYRDAALSLATKLGFRTAVNNPYAGGHITATHGRPREGIHALQIEIDRSVYLDAALSEPGPGFDRTCALIAGVTAVLADAAEGRHALAAE